MKKLLTLLLCTCMLFSFSVYGNAADGEKIFRGAASWMDPTLNPHVDYQGWDVFTYGCTEMLFHIEPDGSVVPFLAESAEANEDASVWTITLKEGVTFSDGTPLTAEQVILNLKDLTEKNSRFGYLADAEMTAESELVVSVALKAPYITFKNDLADPDTAMIKMGEGEDIEMSPICTGPFVVTAFTPEQEVTLVKNENYWNGEPKIDGVHYTLVAEQDTQTMAMQNGEICALSSPSAEALEIFGAEPDLYDIVYAPTSRLYFYFLNCDTLDADVRKAVIRAVSADNFVTVMGGLVEPAAGPFLSDTAFGKVQAPEHSTEAAAEILAAAGYEKNGDGIFEKDGQALVLRLCYYPARSLDKLAALMQEQLKKAGIQAEVQSYEDPDAGYITTGDFDIGLYNCISAPSGDPYYFLNLTMGDGSYNAGHYQNDEIKALLAELSAENDAEKRAELANQIIEKAMADDAYGYLAFTMQATVLQKGVRNIDEDNPYHGGVNVNTVME